MENLIREVDEIRSFAQNDIINEDNTSYLLGDVEDENWADAWQFLDKIDKKVHELHKHIIEAKRLCGEHLFRQLKKDEKSS